MAGGRGAGTVGLLEAIKKDYSVDEIGIADQLTGQLQNRIPTALPFVADQLTEADLMRFVLQRNGVPDLMMRQESTPSSNLEENFKNTAGAIAARVAGTNAVVGVVSGAPMRLRLGAVAAGLKEKLGLSYEPVVMDVGPIDLSLFVGRRTIQTCPGSGRRSVERSDWVEERFK